MKMNETHDNIVIHLKRVELVAAELIGRTRPYTYNREHRLISHKSRFDRPEIKMNEMNEPQQQDWTEDVINRLKRIELYMAELIGRGPKVSSKVERREDSAKSGG